MWMKIDDRMHAHRKTRAVTKSHPDKSRDAAPMGLWVVAGSWASQNNTDGWVPTDELDRWDDDWEALARRLVRAGYWWPESRDGEDGYGFNDWQEWNNPDGASASGTFGNHVRWHANKGVVKADCEHCPQEPNDPESPPDDPDSSGRYRGDDRGDIATTIGANRLPVPDPTRPDPTQSSCASAHAERDAIAVDFTEWWDEYPRKRGKGQAVRAYRSARKKTSAEVLLNRLREQRAALTARGLDYCPYPATWLNGERWDDEPPGNVTAIREPDGSWRDDDGIRYLPDGTVDESTLPPVSDDNGMRMRPGR